MNGTSAAKCPGCDRFIGPVSTCPYCDTESGRSLAYNTMRACAVFIAIVGVLILLVTASNRKVDIVRAGDITPLMNFASVRFDGKVEKAPYLSKEKDVVDYVSFYADDGSGSIRITAHGSIAQLMVKRMLIPQKGSRVIATGSLRVSAGRPHTLILQSAEDLEVRTAVNGTDRH